jgi:hypothetical protein
MSVGHSSVYLRHSVFPLLMYHTVWHIYMHIHIHIYIHTYVTLYGYRCSSHGCVTLIFTFCCDILRSVAVIVGRKHLNMSVYVCMYVCNCHNREKAPEYVYVRMCVCM